jgi:hypothetical protein
MVAFIKSYAEARGSPPFQKKISLALSYLANERYSAAPLIHRKQAFFGPFLNIYA